MINIEERGNTLGNLVFVYINIKILTKLKTRMYE